MIANLIHRTLTPKIAPMIYIMMGVSVFIGFCFAFDVIVGFSESILYTAGTLIDPRLWGAVLLTTSLIAEAGFYLDNDSLINFGGIMGFMAWLFACISLAMGGHWYIMISVGLFHLLFHGYVVLATSLGYLRRQPIS